MIIKNIDRALDMELSFTLTTRNPLAAFSEKYNLFALSTWVYEESNFVLYYVIPVMDTITVEMRMFLEGLGATRKDDIWLVNRGRGGYIGKTVLDLLAEVPSVVLDYCYLGGDRLHFSYRFHSSDKGKISNTILGRLDNGLDFKSLEIKKSEGLTSTMKFIGAKTSVCMLQVSCEMLGTFSSEEKFLAEHKWIRERRFQSNSNGMSALYYFSGTMIEPPPSFVEISHKDQLYSSKVSWQVISFIESACSKLVIPVISATSRSEGKTVYCEFVLPAALKGKLIEVIDRARKEYPNYNIVISEMIYL